MNTAIIIIVALAAIIEMNSFIKCKKYGVRYNPMIMNLINIIRLRKDPEAYMQYAYTQITDQDRYFSEVKKAMMKNSEVSEEYADSIINLSKEMMMG